MERQIDMNEVSDGRCYTANDLVRADCGGCQGCSACCRKMKLDYVRPLRCVLFVQWTASEL